MNRLMIGQQSLSSRFCCQIAAWVWVGLSVFLGSAASAQDHITHRSWTLDTSGQWQWPEVAQQATQAFEGVLSQGFGPEVLWVKLRIDSQGPASPQNPADLLVLRIRPVYLDDVQVFDPLAGGQLGVVGDRHPPRGQFFEGLDFMLPIARGDKPRDIWLRVASTSTRQLSVQAVEPHVLDRLTQKQQLLFALYVGVIFVFIVWGFMHWAFSQETVIGAFGLKQTAALVFALNSLGFTRTYWPADWPAHWLDISTSVSAILAVSSAIFFHKLLVQEFDPPKWIRHVITAMLCLLPVKLVLLAIGSTGLALRLNMLEVLLVPLILWVAAVLSGGWDGKPNRSRPLLNRWVVIGFYTFLVGLMALASLPGLGLAQGGEVPLYIVQAHGLLTAFLILLMLQYRNHLRLKEQHNTSMALQRSQFQAHQEKTVREEQSKLLAMLAHEIKTPLATLYMRLDANALASKAITGAMRDMDAVIERCLQTAQLGDSQLQARLDTLDVVTLVHECAAACGQPELVKLQLPKSLVLKSDRQLLAIVLNNLIENALKYGVPQQHITVALSLTSPPDGHTPEAWLEVINLPSSSGWPEADKIFTKYHRGPHARRQAGTGLGLYLVRNILSVLQGQIVYDPLPHSIRFTVKLPLKPA
jgi:signal transduction histidine kinase